MLFSLLVIYYLDLLLHLFGFNQFHDLRLNNRRHNAGFEYYFLSVSACYERVEPMLQRAVLASDNHIYLSEQWVAAIINVLLIRFASYSRFVHYSQHFNRVVELCDSAWCFIGDLFCKLF